MRRAVLNLPDELRGARGACETASRYAHDTCRRSCVEKIRHVFCLSIGEWLLVLAAAGDVGMVAIQIGKGVR
jgi:NADPH:quinone reductase-like Zn-dependent oxidoreductase